VAGLRKTALPLLKKNGPLKNEMHMPIENQTDSPTGLSETRHITKASAEADE
jgi:hypothetical protein